MKIALLLNYFLNLCKVNTKVSNIPLLYLLPSLSSKIKASRKILHIVSNCCFSLQLCAVLEDFLAGMVRLGRQGSVWAVEINTKGVMIKEFGAKCSAQAYVHE